MSSDSKRLSLKENVLFRLIGLFIFLAPNRGAAFFADVSIEALKRAGKLRVAGTS